MDLFRVPDLFCKAWRSRLSACCSAYRPSLTGARAVALTERLRGGPDPPTPATGCGVPSFERSTAPRKIGCPSFLGTKWLMEITFQPGATGSGSPMKGIPRPIVHLDIPLLSDDHCCRRCTGKEKLPKATLVRHKAMNSRYFTGEA